MSFTYKEWSNTVERLASKLLLSSSIKPKDRVLLVYPPSIDFMIALYACLRAGIIPVPVYPPNPQNLNKDIAQFISIQRTSGANVALTSNAYNYAKSVGGLRNMFSKSKTMRWPELEWIVTDKTAYEKLEKISNETFLPKPSALDVAFLQFTSGSTSAPKGVTVSHENLGHNLTLISEALVGKDQLGTPVVVSWLPQYHDMGLIGSWMGAMYTGGCGYYISPVTFMQNPVLWLELMSRYKCTLCDDDDEDDVFGRVCVSPSLPRSLLPSLFSSLTSSLHTTSHTHTKTKQKQVRTHKRRTFQFA